MEFLKNSVAGDFVIWRDYDAETRNQKPEISQTSLSFPRKRESNLQNTELYFNILLSKQKDWIPVSTGMTEFIIDPYNKISIAANPELALELGAFGVHIPRWYADFAAIKMARAGGLYITASVHNEQELERAYQMQADAILLSPIFPTNSHPDAITLGIEGLKYYLSISKLPIYALGGIKTDNMQLIQNLAIKGFASSGGFWQAS
jgi:hypothetical protein